MKHAREMTETERDATLAELKRGPADRKAKDKTEAERKEWLAEHYPVLRPKPEPMPIDKTAREMTDAQRQEWLAEYKRRLQ
jgi:hypothetical protein